MRRFFLQHAGHDLDARIAQHLEPAALHARIGIFHRRNHARDTGLDQRVRTRRRLPEMRAGFERDIGGGTPRRLARLLQRDGLRMRPPTRLRPAAPDDTPASITSRSRIQLPDWARPPKPARRQRQRVTHVAHIVHGESFNGMRKPTPIALWPFESAGATR